MNNALEMGARRHKLAACWHGAETYRTGIFILAAGAGVRQSAVRIMPSRCEENVAIDRHAGSTAVPVVWVSPTLRRKRSHALPLSGRDPYRHVQWYRTRARTGAGPSRLPGWTCGPPA